MSGHSKWSTIKHKKAVTDAKRANVFTKLGRLIAIAAKEGGGNTDTNFKLKMAIDQARSANMPGANIERAIKKGTGELDDGVEIQEIIYEAYGPGNVAMLIKTVTDNKNRTVSEIKNILTKNGGKMVPEGSVSFLFNQVGIITVIIENIEKNDLELQAIDAGAEDIAYEGNIANFHTKPENLQQAKENLEEKGIKIENAELSYIPIQKAELDRGAETSYKNLLEALDDQDDVQEICDNL